ncbi:helix-turn-helix domain-containing protein [Lysinibacillus sp. RS5]|uniref:helix-turn-helix domain-containing protein n=1 Tax=unclassified Lysinibacillus TaxID=2636778 RepID=UPI0035BE3A71
MTGFIHCNLRVLMAERGLNIQNVKDQTTLSRTTISNLYNNYGSGVQFDTLTQLCSLLKCTPCEILTFVNISVNFEDITSNIDTEIMKNIFITDPSEGDGYEYVSQLNMSLMINCEINYGEKALEFEFKINTVSEIDEKKNVLQTDKEIHKEYQSNLDNLKAPIYVVDYVNEQLDQFLFEKINDTVNSIIL